MADSLGDREQSQVMQVYAFALFHMFLIAFIASYQLIYVLSIPFIATLEQILFDSYLLTTYPA